MPLRMPSTSFRVYVKKRFTTLNKSAMANHVVLGDSANNVSCLVVVAQLAKGKIGQILGKDSGD